MMRLPHGEYKPGLVQLPKPNSAAPESDVTDYLDGLWQPF